jgi:phosphatidylinositol alpha-1,6-mannosyltransferase
VPPRPLFVTRKFPPSIGGMQTLADGVWRALSAASPDAMLIAHGGSNRELPRWLPVAVFRTVSLVARRRVNFVVCGDAVMYLVLAPVLRVLGVRHATMVMGLDLTYPNPIYRAVLRPLLRRAPQVLAVSAATAEVARRLGIPADRVSVVPLGVEVPPRGASRAEARRQVGLRIGVGDDAVILLTLGRLVRRKGARWFVETVLPRLPEHVVYVLVGEGGEADPVLASAVRAGVADRVHLMGRVDDADREIFMRGADVFVQPNIRVSGDMEGFGLVTVEAAMRGAPVVAAALEGILDAVVDGVTGVLLPPEDTESWVASLLPIVSNRELRAELSARGEVAARERYSEVEMRRALGDLLSTPARQPLG